jgi:hypothetical protein
MSLSNLLFLGDPVQADKVPQAEKISVTAPPKVEEAEKK